ncbi:MAG: hypothetical protein J5582_10650 [Ruminococcus sp.]|uniref:hypothetical protein n=1 Tax=Ruminococcus sp. TaxID=41978 RepID=UPI0025D5A05B|nr:hypothetical protein [Ruminococcus sp.]MBO4866999.1 hypothetical protein [Ruminococcus sp.]
MILLIFLLIIIMAVEFIGLVISSSKRFTVTESAKMAGGVVFMHKDPELLKGVKQGAVIILITAFTFHLNSIFRWDEFVADKAAIFYSTVLFLEAVNMLYTLVQYNRYDEFRLCANCFYLGGVKYDLKNFTCAVEENTAIFRPKHGREKRVKIPPARVPEVLRILDRAYVRIR